MNFFLILIDDFEEREKSKYEKKRLRKELKEEDVFLTEGEEEEE